MVQYKPEAHHSKSLWSFHIFPPKILNTCNIPHAIGFLNCKPWNSVGKASSAWQLLFQRFWWLGMTELSISLKHALRKVLTYSTSLTELTDSSPLCQERPLGAVY